jgi:hypothetical protein
MSISADSRPMAGTSDKLSLLRNATIPFPRFAPSGNDDKIDDSQVVARMQAPPKGRRRIAAVRHSKPDKRLQGIDLIALGV